MKGWAGRRERYLNTKTHRVDGGYGPGELGQAGGLPFKHFVILVIKGLVVFIDRVERTEYQHDDNSEMN